jgi:aminoglycoside phosphotransferase (APT) family kinase protein
MSKPKEQTKLKHEPQDPHPIPVTEETVSIVAQHHFGKTPKKITQLTTGLANFVYEVDMGGEKYIFRLSDLPLKLGYFLKEQWAVGQARERGVPAPDILEVGNEVVPNPYMIVHKVGGINALEHGDRTKVIHDMGKYAAIINTIPTTGFGHVFDWSSNKLSKRETIKDFIEKEWDAPARIQILEEFDMLTKNQFKKLRDILKEMESWDQSPTLNHCDLRLKNILINDEGNISAVLDWENCISFMSPHWEISIALHDLTIDEKQVFLDGYGIRPKDMEKMSDRVKAINTLNYALHIRSAANRKDSAALEKFRARLRGALDLYL